MSRDTLWSQSIHQNKGLCFSPKPNYNLSSGIILKPWDLKPFESKARQVAQHNHTWKLNPLFLESFLKKHPLLNVLLVLETVLTVPSAIGTAVSLSLAECSRFALLNAPKRKRIRVYF